MYVLYRCHWQRSNTWNATWCVKDPPPIEWKDICFHHSHWCVWFPAPHPLTYVCKYKCTYASPTSPEPGDNHEHAGGLGDPGRAQKHQRAAEEGEDSSGGRLPEWRKGEVAVDPELVLQRSDTRTAGGAEGVRSDLAASSTNPDQTAPSHLVPGSSHPTPSRKLQPVHPPDVHVPPKWHHPTHGRVREVWREKMSPLVESVSQCLSAGVWGSEFRESGALSSMFLFFCTGEWGVTPFSHWTVVWMSEFLNPQMFLLFSGMSDTQTWASVGPLADAIIPHALAFTRTWAGSSQTHVFLHGRWSARMFVGTHS